MPPRPHTGTKIMPVLLARTSVTIDEAIAYLMGMVDGPVTFHTTDIGSSTELEMECEHMSFNLNELLEDEYEDAVGALAEARLDHPEMQTLENFEAQVTRARNKIKNAYEIRALIEDELLKPASGLRIDHRLSIPHLQYISLISLREWAEKCRSIAEIQQQLDRNEEAKHTANQEPWWVKNIEDPEPKEGWYTPARYFARQLIKDDVGLAKKRDSLATRVAHALAEHKIFKRGGKEKLQASTIRKSFSNVRF